MLTPKHRALFAAAYCSPILRVASDDTEVHQATPAPAEPAPATKNDEEPRLTA
jgi:hypothetical protein